MKKWTDDFLNRCLDGLPKDKYRQRAQAELEDHLLTLAQELEDAGDTSESAQIKALELMGKPEELSESFRVEWVRRANRIGYSLRRVLLWGFYGLLLNALIRAVLTLPSVVFMQNQAKLSPFILFFFAIWFLPGLWFAIHHVRGDFSLFSYRRQMLLINAASLFFWLLDLSPVILTVMVPPLDDISLPFVLCCYLPLIVAEGDFFLAYLATTGALCVALPHFIRPQKKNK